MSNPSFTMNKVRKSTRGALLGPMYIIYALAIDFCVQVRGAEHANKRKKRQQKKAKDSKPDDDVDMQMTGVSRQKIYKTPPRDSVVSGCHF